MTVEAQGTEACLACLGGLGRGAIVLQPELVVPDLSRIIDLWYNRAELEGYLLISVI